MALAKVLSQCVGPGGQLVANAVIVQQLLPASGVRGLHVARILFYNTAPTAEDAGAEAAAHGDQEYQRQPAVTHLLAAVQNSSSARSLSRRLNATGILGGSSSTGGMLVGWSTFTTTGMQQHYATMAAAADAGHTSSESESDAESDDKGGLLTAQQYRSKYSMWVHPPSAPAPCQTFEQAGLPPQLLKGLLRHGFTAPTFIQAQAWPIAFEGRDLVAIASTGSGKTAGFLLPAFLHIKQQQALLQQQQGSSGMGQQQQQQQQRGRGGRSWSKWNQPGAWGQMQPPVALVLAPTRELAQQTQQEAERLGGRDIITACLYGGASKVTQARALQRGPQLIIATPGRLLDFANSGEVNLSRMSMLVLDEADRMLDMGFEPQIRDLMDFMPGGEYAMAPRPDDLPVPPRQTLFFSATWPKEVQAIARQLCRNDPVQVFVGNVQEKLVANRDVTQLVAMLSRPDDRLPTVMDYLHEHLHGAERLNGAPSFDSGSSRSSSSSRDKHAAEHPSAVLDADVTHPRVVIFCETKRECDHLAVALSREGIKAAAVHGDKSQSDRDYSLRAFRQGRVPVLVATDVAARGLDIPGVTAVINYSFPRDHEMYIHRIGRTGRAGRKGESLTLLTPTDASVTPLLVDIMRDAGQEIPSELQAAAARVRRPAQNKSRYGSSGGGRGGRGGGYGGRGSSRGGGWGSRGGGGRQQWSGGRDEWAQGGGRRDTNSRSDSWNGGSRGGSRGGGRDGWGEVGSRKQRVAEAWE